MLLMTIMHGARLFYPGIILRTWGCFSPCVSSLFAVLLYRGLEELNDSETIFNWAASMAHI